MMPGAAVLLLSALVLPLVAGPFVERRASGPQLVLFSLGSLLALAIGLVLGVVEGRADPPPRWLTLGLTTGILGGFTTFSAFAYDTVSHIEAGDAPLALAYVLGTVVLGIAAAAGGLALGRSL